jgi:hypothetical protein
MKTKRRKEMHRVFDVKMMCSAEHIDSPTQWHKHSVVLCYDKDNPAAVELVFLPELESWTFSRDLLFQAAIQGVPSGEQGGDIDFTPVVSERFGNHIVMVLRGHDPEGGPDLTEKFILDRRTAQKFLYATFDHVPLGEEDYSAQVDAFLHVMQLGRES